MIFKHNKNKTTRLFSSFLQRMVDVEVISTPGTHDNIQKGLLFLNDGQLSDALHIRQAINKLHASGRIMPVTVAAVHAGERQSEYGVSGVEDFMGRGEKAEHYENFITRELLPWMHVSTPGGFSPLHTAFAGCSLGGLSAIDIVSSNPSLFATAGIFSGSLWWRSKSYEEGYTDNDRIIFNKLTHTSIATHFRCYLMAGTNDEKNDRNGNGIIDAVDDTLDMFDLLSAKISCPEKKLCLSIVDGGRHEPATWSAQIPEFLVHAFGIPKSYMH